jgi:hypothetical protein
LLAVGVEFDVTTEDIADGTRSDEIGNALGTGEIGGSVVDDEAAGQEKIAGEKQSGLAIVIGDVGGVMSGSRNHVNDAIAEIDLRKAVRPIGEAKVLPDVSEVGGDNFDIGKVLELRIAEAMIEVTVGVHNDER